MSDRDDMRVIAWIDQLLTFAGEALNVIRKDEHYSVLLRWARGDGAALLGDDFALAQALAPLLWNQTPLLRCEFDTEQLALPDANEGCWCDSGKPYQNCCARVELSGPVPDNLMWMLSLCHWRGQPFIAAINSGQAPLQALLEAAIVESESHQTSRAIRLLEALYTTRKASQEPFYLVRAFEQLEALYHARGFHRKRSALFVSAMGHESSQLKGAALEQYALSDLENDDLAAARANFEEAQRLLPNAPMLAYLETMLLLQEGHADKARQRAAFWHRRLSRAGNIDDDELAFVRQLARDPADALTNELISADEELAEDLFELRRVLTQMPTAMLIGIQKNAQGALVYHPSAKDMQTYAQWAAYSQTGANVEVEANQLWQSAPLWLPALNKHPSWLASPLVVRELATALASRFGNLPWMNGPFIMPLVRCFEHWLATIEKRQAPLPWELGQNQALYLCGVALVSALERGSRTHSRRLATRLYCLDRNDPLGLKELVLEHYLNQGNDEQVVALCQQGASADVDVALMEQLALALSCYRLGRLDEARSAIRRAIRLNRHVPGMLVETRIHPQRFDEHAIRPGSRDQAWQARLLLRDCWAATPGALDWLKAQYHGTCSEGR